VTWLWSGDVGRTDEPRHGKQDGARMMVARCLIVLVLLFALTGCNSSPRKVRYRLTIDVSVDGAIKSGSSVGEITYGFNDGLFKNMGSYFWSGCKCEAVAVDLGSRGTVFAGLTYYDKRFRGPSNLSSLLVDLFPETKHGGAEPDSIDALARHVGAVDIAVDYLPILLRFRDLDNLRSVELIDPEHLDATFGSGVKFARATMEIVNAPLTTGIEKRLPWWNGSEKWVGLENFDGQDRVLVDKSLFRLGSD
jgi:hypothetical protein